MQEEKRVKSEGKKENVKKLTKKQLEVLRLAYRFRFLTSHNLASYDEQSQTTSAYVRLTALVRLGYLARRYDRSYRLQNRPAEYYLLPTTRSILREALSRPSERELKRLYARPSASPRFIDRSLALFESYLALRRLYGSRMTVASQAQLNIDEFAYFPHPLPDAFVTLDAGTDRERHCFVEYFDDAISIGLHGRRIASYMAYEETGEWEATDFDFPTVIIVCQSNALLRQADKRVRYLERQVYSEITFRLIDQATLRELDSPRKKAWLDPIEKEKVVL